MAVSRLRSLRLIKDNNGNLTYETPEFPGSNELRNISYNLYTVIAKDRLDVIAAKTLGDDKYWWIIAMMNNLKDLFDVTPGDIIRIPKSVNDFLEYI